MEKFNIKRLVLTMKWTICASRRSIISITACLMFAYMVPLSAVTLQCLRSPGYCVENNMHIATQTCSAMFFVFLMMGGCWIFDNMKTKEQRIIFKMLPAPDTEKFIARALCVTAVWALMGIAAFCAADILRMAIQFIASPSAVQSLIPDFIDFNAIHLNITESTSNQKGINTTTLAISFYSFLVWAHSLYVLGGTFFRRQQFVFTTLTHFMLGIIVSLVLSSTANITDENSAVGYANAMTLTFAVLFPVLTLLDWWLAYRIFKRMQVINNKWINA